MSINDAVISVLLPTRGRREALQKSLLSLMSKVADPSRIELLLGLDEDDPETIEFVKTVVAADMKALGVHTNASLFKPLGYENLHLYVNHLASCSRGDWLFFWNDDAIMETDNWDNEIASYTGQFKLLAPKDNHNGHPYAIFPIVPKDWFILMDHLSQNAQNDAWLSHIAYMLDIFQRIDVTVMHDRADLTGNNNDATFAARKYMEGNPSDPRDFMHPNHLRARLATAYKIAWYMDKMGYDTSWWDDVVAGKQHPLEKMVFPNGVKGAGQLAANLNDEEIITL